MDMARYYFDLINGNGPIRDDQGQEVTTREGISREVSRILADIAREELPDRENGAITIEVRDEQGQPVLTGSLSFRTRWHDQSEF